MINKSSSLKSRGRPRKFDREVALGKATQVFWILGYEGASIADLTAAMEITPQSLYSAFKSKSALFRESLNHYQQQIGSYALQALTEEKSIINALTRLLRESAYHFSQTKFPKGCMISTAVLACAVENNAEAEYVAMLRERTLSAIQARIQDAVIKGELHSNTDSAALAHYLGALIQGMSVQARDGASEEDLTKIANIAILVLQNYFTTVAKDVNE